MKLKNQVVDEKVTDAIVDDNRDGVSIAEEE